MRFDAFPKDYHAEMITKHFGGRLTSGSPPLPLKTLTFICFTNRCGSTAVCSALSRLGLAGKPNSFFNYEFCNFDAVSDPQHQHQTFQDYLDHCCRQYSTHDHSLTLKTSIRQLNFLWEASLFHYLSRRAEKSVVVWVRRRNILAQAVSLSVALQNKQWTSLHGSESGRPLVFNSLHILQLAREIAEQNANADLFFNYHGISPRIIWYEDDVEPGEDALLAKLAELYNVDVKSVGPSLLPVARQVMEIKNRWEARLRSEAQAVVDPSSFEADKSHSIRSLNAALTPVKRRHIS